MKTYLLPVALLADDDGRWTARIDALPGCSAWGYTREEALDAVRGAASAYIQDMIDAGETLPREGVHILDAPAVTISVS